VIQTGVLESLLPALTGILFGLAASAIAWGWLQGRRAADLRALLTAREAACTALQQDLGAAREECARVGAQLQAANVAAAEKVELLQGAELRLREAFAALSSAFADFLSFNGG